MNRLERNKRNNNKYVVRRLSILVVILIIIAGFGFWITKTEKDNKVVQQSSSNTQKTTQSTQKTTSNNNATTQNSKKYDLGTITPPYAGYNPDEIVKGENIIESAQAYAVPANEVAQMIAGNSKDTNKEVFLTFDDGPSVNNTPKILNILKENGVHGTFFTIGNNLKNNPKLQQVLREEIADGNAIGNHTYNHELKQLYPGNKVNPTEFINQVDETNALFDAILGPNFNTRVLRLPGGYMSRTYYKDPNLESFNEALDKAHITAIDWDAETGDAETTSQMSVSKMVANVTRAASKENHVIILMHDAPAKSDTVKALPDIIKYFKDHGYAFKVIENAPASSFENLPVKTTTDSNQGQ
ncbi:polysaccharide deacetylase family protein [Clostridium massiliamazoniense]|uniref:polysaccharide deacetylase family protein n=1 Tax=Clostridium massiliamazoniense TaxID=1347366 RepID=UPI0006D84E51|nr:polysaccharide deacetylase family protein [Clostridium massiliamazoniense]